jgi:hypothetical protein
MRDVARGVLDGPHTSGGASRLYHWHPRRRPCPIASDSNNLALRPIPALAFIDDLESHERRTMDASVGDRIVVEAEQAAQSGQAGVSSRRFWPCEQTLTCERPLAASH